LPQLVQLNREVLRQLLQRFDGSGLLIGQHMQQGVASLTTY
jgi:hypothetical protein